MTTLEYWEEREKAHAAQTKLEDDVLAKRIRDRLDVLMVDMDKQINGFYSRYAKAEGITMAEAQQRVSKMDVKAFEAKAAKYVKNRDFSKQANDELRLYNATMKINRLEMLKAEMGLEMLDAFGDVEGMMTEGLTQRTLDEFERQAGILGVHNQNMTGKVDSIVNGSLNNATWSQRIWMYQGMLKNSLADLLTNGIIQGKNPRDLAIDLVKTFGVTKSNAERLMRTEMCRVQTEAQMESFKENGFERYMFISTEDSHVCAVCNGLNGKVFKISDQKAGENAPPMHPNCRCSTAAAFYDREVFDEWLDTGAAKEGVSIENFATGNDSVLGRANPKTGDLSTEEHLAAKRETDLRSKKDITESWIKDNKRGGTVSKASSVVVAGKTLPVDGRKIKVDPSVTEKAVAKILSERYGCDVTFLPKIKEPRNIRMADYLVNGEKYDLKSPSGKGAHTLYENAKSCKGQADNMILDLTNSPLDAKSIEKQIEEIFRSNHTLFIDKVVIYSDAEIKKVFQRKRI